MIQAITFDLDDTLWPVAPVIAAAEQAVHDWFAERVPTVAERFDVEDLRQLRIEVAEHYPDRAHDLSTMRRLSLREACRRSGVDEVHAEAAFQAFFKARNRVHLYPDAAPTLARLAAHHPLVALTNGNADLQLTGLHEWFRFSVSAIQAGAAKPDPRMFHHAAERLNLPAHRILHVGDDPERDVAGAQAAGCHAVLLDRDDRHGSDPEGLLRIRRLDELPSLIGL